MRTAISPRLAISTLRNILLSSVPGSLYYTKSTKYKIQSSNDNRIHRPVRIVTNDNLFSGNVIGGTLLLEIAERLRGFILNPGEHVGVGNLGDAAVLVGNCVDDPSVGHAARF